MEKTNEKANEKTLIPADQEKTAVYTLARFAGFLAARIFFPARYHQAQTLNDTGAPYIVMANHQSWLDPLLVIHACKKYEIRFMGKKDLLKYPILRKLLPAAHLIPVDRTENSRDMTALRMSVKALADRRVLGIFPEGTRYGGDLMSTVMNGTAVLALRSKAPLLPVYIARKPRLFRRTDVYVGQPIEVAALCPDGFNASQVQPLSERIRECFLAMREEAQRAEKA